MNIYKGLDYQNNISDFVKKHQKVKDLDIGNLILQRDKSRFIKRNSKSICNILLDFISGDYGLTFSDYKAGNKNSIKNKNGNVIGWYSFDGTYVYVVNDLAKRETYVYFGDLACELIKRKAIRSTAEVDSANPTEIRKFSIGNVGVCQDVIAWVTGKGYTQSVINDILHRFSRADFGIAKVKYLLENAESIQNKVGVITGVYFLEGKKVCCLYSSYYRSTIVVFEDKFEVIHNNQKRLSLLRLWSDD